MCHQFAVSIYLMNELCHQFSVTDMLMNELFYQFAVTDISDERALSSICCDRYV